jgi:hypothetical protein
MDIGKLFKRATKEIGENYFQLPIYGQEDPLYRERVYCYELYHQLRSSWLFNDKYELCGEVDKAGHPLIRNNNLDNTKPDFLIHVPGSMDCNLAVIEVKPIKASKKGMKKDLKTLTAFCKSARYKKAIYLFYGDDTIETIIRIIKQCSQNEDDIELGLIEFWHHKKVGDSAYKFDLFEDRG